MVARLQQKVNFKIGNTVPRKLKRQPDLGKTRLQWQRKSGGCLIFCHSKQISPKRPASKGNIGEDTCVFFFFFLSGNNPAVVRRRVTRILLKRERLEPEV